MQTGSVSIAGRDHRDMEHKNYLDEFGAEAQIVLAGCAIASMMYVGRHGIASAFLHTHHALRSATYDATTGRLCGVPSWAALLVALTVLANRYTHCGSDAGGLWGKIVHWFSDSEAKSDDARSPRASAAAAADADAVAAPRVAVQTLAGPSTNNVYIISSSDGTTERLPQQDSSEALRTLARVVGVLTGQTAAQRSDIDEIKATLRSTRVAGQLASVRVDMTKLSKQQQAMKEAQYVEVIKTIIDRATAT